MKKLFPAIIVLLFFQLPSFAQDYRDLDSLQAELKEFTSSKVELDNGSISLQDTTQAKLLYELSKVHWYNNFGKAIENANQCINLSSSIDYKEGIVDGFYSLATVYLNRGDDSLALEFANKTLSLAIELNNKHRIADAYVALGYIHCFLGNFVKAQEDCIKGLSLAEEINYIKCISIAYCNLGSVNFALGNTEKALNYYIVSMQTAKKSSYKFGLAASNHNIGLIHIFKGENSKALFYLKEALKKNKEIGNKLWEAYNLDLIGAIHENDGDLKEGLRYSLLSENILRGLGEKIKLCSTLNNVGWMYIGIGDYVKARAYLNESAELGIESSYFDGLWGTYESLVTLDSLEGNWKLAYEHHLKFISCRDSINSKDNIKKTVESGMKFEFDKKQLSDSMRFLQEKVIGEIKLQKQKTYTYGGLLVIILTVVLLFFVYRNYKKQQLANQMLKEAQEQLIRNEKLAAFGIMASKVAHEIQNPLNFVNNFSDLSKEIIVELLSATDEEEKKVNSIILIDNLQRINEHGKRAADIVKQLQEHTLRGTAHEFFE